MRAASTATASTPKCIAFLSSQFDMAFLLPAFRERFPDAELRLAPDLEGDPTRLAAVDAAVCWAPEPGLLARMPSLRLVQSLGAGIDHLVSDPHLPDVPVCRIIDPDMASGMTAYVAWAVIQHQRSMRAYLESGRRAAWEEQPIRAPRTHTVGIAGLGALGLACAKVLLALGYQVRGWSRQPKAGLPNGLESFYEGMVVKGMTPDETARGEASPGERSLGETSPGNSPFDKSSHNASALNAFLSGCDTLVCLLPLTPETEGVLNAELFSHLPQGAHLINVGRGAHLVEADLLAALESGQLSAATLDTFSQEPLPKDHPFWHDPRIVVTPHVATRTSPKVIASQTQTHFAQIHAGLPATGAVSLARGY